MKINKITYIITLILISLYFISCENDNEFPIPPIPKEAFLKETFNNVDPNSSLTISKATNFDNGLPITYSDPYNTTEIQSSKTFNSPFAWFPPKENASLIINGLNLINHPNPVLKYKFNANLIDYGETSNTRNLIIKCNDVEIDLPSTILNTVNNKNSYITVKITIPNNTNKIEFYSKAENNEFGFRIDDIEIYNY